MYSIVGRIVNNRETIGYQLIASNGELKKASKDETFNLARNYKINNAKYNDVTRGLAGRNGFDLRKLPVYNASQNKHDSSRGNHKAARGYESKQRLIGGGFLLKFAYLDNDEVMLVDVGNKNDTGTLIIPSFVSSIYIKSNVETSYLNNSPLSRCKYTEIIVENQPNKEFDAKYLCALMNSTSITLKFKHPECITSLDGCFYSCDKCRTIDISSIKSLALKSTKNMFEWCSRLQSINFGEFNTSNVVDMEAMFRFCGIKLLNLESFRTSNVRNMAYLFYGCQNLYAVNLSKFDTSNVTDMSSMFDGCEDLSLLDISSFRTNKVRAMPHMFDGCKRLDRIDLKNFDTSNLVYMNSMFQGCERLLEIDLSSFDTCNVKDMSRLFNMCINLVKVDIRKFRFRDDVNIDSMFKYCQYLEEIVLKTKAHLQLKYQNSTFVGCRVDRIKGLSQLCSIQSKEEWLKEMQNSNQKVNEIDI